MSGRARLAGGTGPGAGGGWRKGDEKVGYQTQKERRTMAASRCTDSESTCEYAGADRIVWKPKRSNGCWGKTWQGGLWVESCEPWSRLTFASPPSCFSPRETVSMCRGSHRGGLSQTCGIGGTSLQSSLVGLLAFFCGAVPVRIAFFHVTCTCMHLLCFYLGDHVFNRI